MAGRSDTRIRKIIAGTVGNTLEWYDFAVYGYLAPILAQQFFPSDDPTVSLISTFGVFAAGFLMRPIGSLLLGHIADKTGRSRALLLSVALMAIPTTLIAFLPTYDQIGIAAPVLLTLLRLLQGLSVGGEYTGSTVYLYEIAPPKRRCFTVSWALVGATFGILLGSGVAALATGLLPADDLGSWGWRIPFGFGLLVGLTGFMIRSGTKAEEKDQPPSSHDPVSAPVGEVLRNHRPALLRTIACNILNGVGFYLTFVYLTSYLVDYVKFTESRALTINTSVMVVFMLLLPIVGYLADRIDRRTILLFGSGGVALFALPMFWLVHHPDPLMVILGQLGMAVILTAFFAPLMAAMVGQFPVSVRVTGYSIGYNIPLALFGGTAPLFATYLIDKTHLQLAPAFYMIAAGLLAFVVIWFMPSEDGSISQDEEAEPAPT
ncbi:MHS family MFS transporter [Labrenzia sp. 5N]|uniref:MFS transporter n=1 Tax=Labrenzia sp. 5N TaxID=2723402 RepID=UPI001444C22F|nr:MFS transporter [Labrenzia sp. 5N]NKX65338.1 MHS family MFS transporter [Labrenzia sp. 5N]